MGGPPSFLSSASFKQELGGRFDGVKGVENCFSCEDSTGFETRGHEYKLQTIISYMESGGSQSSGTESTDTQRFFADVITAVDQRQDGYQLEELMFDALHTEDLMWDPVKASDGYTYDRWTIVQNDDHHRRSLSDGRSPFNRAPLSVLCDDVTVRQRLYTIEKFRNEGVEKKSKEMREKYRTKTLELVKDGHDGEALERLENLLKWAPDDEECRTHQDVISNRLRQHRNERKQKPRFSHWKRNWKDSAHWWRCFNVNPNWMRKKLEFWRNTVNTVLYAG
ncbi:hypothetical protein R1flu_016683 [Riccia fluitans]|uniref:U-box domain-containing protein n=1 Tax=Riccia fluitans TaxID=41844 RepID=A0ABD1YMK3_9MARC